MSEQGLLSKVFYVAFDLLNFPISLVLVFRLFLCWTLGNDFHFHFISFPALLLLKKKAPLWVAPTSDECLESALVEGWLA